MKTVTFERRYEVKEPTQEGIEIGYRLKMAFAEEGLGDTQVDIAKAIKVSQMTVSYWIRGIKIPPIHTGVVVARKCGICVEWLYTGKGPKHPEPPSKVIAGSTGERAEDDRRDAGVQADVGRLSRMRGFFCLVRKNRFCFDDRGVACKCRGRGRDNLSVVGYGSDIPTPHPGRRSPRADASQLAPAMTDQRRQDRTVVVITGGYDDELLGYEAGTD